MPGRNGMGPMAQGQGRGQSQGRMVGRGRGPGYGAGGVCVCPQCGEKVVHQRGLPCNAAKCPKCATQMIRE